MSLKKEYWVLDSVSYMNDPQLPPEVAKALDDFGGQQEWGNDAYHDTSVADLLYEYQEEGWECAKVLGEFLVSQGAKEDDNVLIHWWW